MDAKFALAKETASVCIACLSLAWNPAAIGAAAVPLISVFGLGVGLWKKCPVTATEAAIKNTLQGMGHANIPAAHIDAARKALQNLPSAVTLDGAVFSAAAKAPEGFDASIIATLLCHLPKTTLYDVRSLVETALTAGFAACSNNADFKQALTESLIRETAREMGLVLASLGRLEETGTDTNRKVTELHGITVGLKDQVVAVGALLQNLPYVGRDQLESLASRFEIERVFDLSDAALREALEKRAADYRALKAQIATLAARFPQLGNVVAEARARLETGDTQGVRQMVQDARQVLHDAHLRAGLEQDAELVELDAAAVMFDNQLDQAFTLLSAAADSFAALDPLEPARRRLDYEDRLYQHGLRYGGSGLRLAAQMNADALSKIDQATDSSLWASAQNNLAIALQEQGKRTSGAAAADLLAQAVAAYRAALQVYTQAEHPLHWAGTQNNLATALKDQGTRTGGAEGAALLAQAVAASRAALQVYTQAAHPVHWATTQNNLAAALQQQGTRTGGAEGAALLAQAVAAYRAALQVYTQAEHPVHWAGTQNNLAIALREQGTRTGGAEAAALLAQAVAAYRAALQVRTQAEHPLNWAMTQNNLANALQEQGKRTSGAAGADLLAQAVAASRAALQVYTQAAHPVHWAMTQNNLAIALQEQGKRTSGAAGAELLAQAVITYRAALQVHTQAEHPVDWAMTQENLASLELERSAHDSCPDPLPPLHAALAHVEAALQVYDPVHMTYNHARATTLRDDILTRLRDLGEAP